MSQLIPCGACLRHVRHTESACPFCDARLAPTPARALDPTTRLGRAAMFAFRATAVAALSTMSGCGDDQPVPPPTSVMPPEPSNVVMPYGAPPEPRPSEVPVPPASTTLKPPTDVPSVPISEAPHRRHHPLIGGPTPAYGAPVPAYGAAPPLGE